MWGMVHRLRTSATESFICRHGAGAARATAYRRESSSETVGGRVAEVLRHARADGGVIIESGEVTNRPAHVKGPAGVLRSSVPGASEPICPGGVLPRDAGMTQQFTSRRRVVYGKIQVCLGENYGTLFMHVAIHPPSF